ncbi:MAG: hypothetical protein ACYDCC_04830 [Actinomycetota bacterium]
MSTADAVARETTWFLSDQSGGVPFALPALPATLGGPFTVVQGYYDPFVTRVPSCVIWREDIHEYRLASGGVKRVDYDMVATLYWPKTAGTGKASDDQTNFDIAVDKVIQRIRAWPADHTHGNAFFASGERGLGSGDKGIHVRYANPIVQIEKGAPFIAEVRWMANDILTND